MHFPLYFKIGVGNFGAAWPTQCPTDILESSTSLSPPLCHIQNHVLSILILGHMASILSAVLVRWLHSLLERPSETCLPDQSPSVQLRYCLCGRVPRRGMERIGSLMVNYSGRQSPSAEQASPTREGLNKGLQIVKSGKKSMFLGFIQEHSSQ